MLIFGHGTDQPDCMINSRESFPLVRAAGADGVELDVRLCSDGSLAVIHDHQLADGRQVADLRRSEFPRDLLDLEDALDLCDGMIVNIELKNYPEDAAFDPTEALADAVVESLASRSNSDTVLISSFGLGCIDRVRQLDPDLETAHLVLSRRPVREVIRPAVEHGHRVIHPYLDMVTAEFMDATRESGLRVNVWTGMNEPADTPTILNSLGADGIITPFPKCASRQLTST